ncbi:hypothetical protein AVEN_179904-1 [Araneus ventricosus]|uniref:Uncharacterized protein n=1 Tax=Araneus ventricosus TaxID=182803 RepID=A0A4Y2M679_ARAVE|nr:hypothetical protein AVEN_179904-1 [Araneus ventricosus]
MDNLNIEEATTKELMIILRKILNGGTISNSKEGIMIFRVQLKKDLAAIANKLVVAIERNQNISNSTVKEADSSSNTTVDFKERLAFNAMKILCLQIQAPQVKAIPPRTPEPKPSSHT